MVTPLRQYLCRILQKTALVILSTVLMVSGVTLSASAETGDWKAITEVLQRKMSENQVSGLGLDVYDDQHRLVYSRVFGDFSRTEHYQIASASKWVTTAVILSLVGDGSLSLADTTGKWLGWKGDRGRITLRQLLSLTSGFHIPPMSSPKYFWADGMDLRACVDAIHRDIELYSKPGKIASYGAVGFIIAGRIAEIAAGKDWYRIYRERVGDPLGFDAEKAVYYPPQQVAAGLKMTMEEYGRFLTMVFNHGTFHGKQILSPGLVAEQEKDQWEPGITVESSPYSWVNRDFHYGLRVWRACPDSYNTSRCAGRLIVSSSGFLGWYPWIERSGGMYGMIAMEKPIGTRPPGYIYAFRILEEIRPWLRSKASK